MNTPTLITKAINSAITQAKALPHAINQIAELLRTPKPKPQNQPNWHDENFATITVSITHGGTLTSSNRYLPLQDIHNPELAASTIHTAAATTLRSFSPEHERAFQNINKNTPTLKPPHLTTLKPPLTPQVGSTLTKHAENPQEPQSWVLLPAGWTCEGKSQHLLCCPHAWEDIYHPEEAEYTLNIELIEPFN